MFGWGNICLHILLYTTLWFLPGSSQKLPSNEKQFFVFRSLLSFHYILIHHTEISTAILRTTRDTSKAEPYLPSLDDITALSLIWLN